jgi:hypothetical protein
MPDKPRRDEPARPGHDLPGDRPADERPDDLPPGVDTDRREPGRPTQLPAEGERRHPRPRPDNTLPGDLPPGVEKDRRSHRPGRPTQLPTGRERRAYVEPEPEPLSINELPVDRETGRPKQELPHPSLRAEYVTQPEPEPEPVEPAVPVAPIEREPVIERDDR